MDLSDWLFERAGRQHAIALHRLAELIFLYLTDRLHQDSESVAKSISD